MKTLPNGVTIFNATPHPLRFWKEGWDEPIEVEPDEVISASVEEVEEWNEDGVSFVRTIFLPTEEGEKIVQAAYEYGADIVVGSIIAAQAYPESVFAMTPAPGYERVAPAQKRMNPDKFTVFA